MGCDVFGQYSQNKECVYKCSPNFLIYEFNCLTVKKCIEYKGYIKRNNNENENDYCVKNCDDYFLVNDTNCEESCPDNYFVDFQNKLCLLKCPNDAPYYYSKDKKCINSCGDDYIDDSNNECITNCENIKVVQIKTCFQNIQSNYPFQINNTNEYVSQCETYNNTEYIQKYNENICIKKEDCSNFFF